MNAPRHRIEPAWHYSEAERLALRLEELLADHGITIEVGSPFESHILEVMKLGYQKVSNAAPEEDVRDDHRTLVGVHELASLLVAAAEHPGFPALTPHLRLLSGGNVLQNVPSSQTDQVTNKLFELFVAALALQCGEDVELDHPESSRGDNPDVMLSFLGRRWGIACKVLHSRHPESVLHNLEKGIDQLERSSAEIGFVLFGLKNVIPHSEIWPLGCVEGERDALATGCFEDPAAPFDILVNAMAAIPRSLESYLEAGYLPKTFSGKKSVPGFLQWAHSVSAVEISGKPTACSLRVLDLYPVSPTMPKALERLLKCLRKAVDGGTTGS